jgi:two-component system cell cycle sensor histidine kinase PleC
LSRLVEDILDIAKIDSGKVKIKVKLSKLDKVINEACDVLETWAKAKEIQIVRQVEKTPEMMIDPDKITQILNNLISNAIKFTPASGKITVSSIFVPDKNLVKVSVVDTGVGISKENVAKLFKRFEQFGDQQGIMGTGLGLVISKDFVERHGGEITVDSVENKGTTFTFTLPVKKEDTNTEK